MFDLSFLHSGSLRLKARLARFGVALGVIGVMLALAAPGVSEAATTIYVDNVTPADNCGSYDGTTAQTDPAAAISTAASGSTIVICPGTYNLVGDIVIQNVTKLTVKRALTGPGDTPILVDDPGGAGILLLSDASGVTFDGVVLDASASPLSDSVVAAYKSGLTLKNSAILGPDNASVIGIKADSTGLTKAETVSISDSEIAGFTMYGIEAIGAVKLTVTDTHIDATDNGRVTSFPAVSGVYFNGATSDTVTPTGTVTGSQIEGATSNIQIEETGGVTVSNNTLLITDFGVYIVTAGTYHSADGNTITGNTMLGVNSTLAGVHLNNQSTAATINDTTITGNTFVVKQYSRIGLPYGIFMYSAVPGLVSETVTGNTFLGFSATREIWDSSTSVLTASDNQDIP